MANGRVRHHCPRVPFHADGAQAVELRLANHTADNFAQFKQLYDLEDDPTLVEPGWADALIDFLRAPGMSALLLVIGGVALYLELHIPGIGLGGFVSAVCFMLFFWSHYLPGTAFWLEITLFLAGVGCLLTEVFVVPGTGIFGLGGGAMVLVSLVLASQTFVIPHNRYEFELLERSLLTVAGAAGGAIVAIAGGPPLAAPRAGVPARVPAAARGRRGQGHQPSRNAGRSGKPGWRAGRHHHAAYPRRQGPLRKHPGRCDGRGRADFPRYAGDGHRGPRQPRDRQARGQRGLRGRAEGGRRR